MKELAVGIDLGTTNSVIAFSHQGELNVIADRSGSRIHPSIVAFKENGQVLVGPRAKKIRRKRPSWCVYNIKRLIGRYFKDKEVQRAQRFLPYKLMPGEQGEIMIKMRDDLYSVPEVAAMILTYLKKLAEAATSRIVTQAVITVPAHFNDNQRQATKAAARIAGLEPLRILNEPTAAAIAYGLGQDMQRRVAIYDLGGGTFDISILDISDEVFEVITTAGDTYLGGNDFDRALAAELFKNVKRDYGLDITSVPGFMHNLLRVAEQVKILLSENKHVSFKLENLLEIAGERRDLEMEFHRRRLGEISRDLVQKTFLVCDEALGRANLKANEIHDVICIGGQSQMPLIQKAVMNYFGRPPRVDIDPMEVVAVGAAVLAEQLTQNAASNLRDFYALKPDSGLFELPEPTEDAEAEELDDIMLEPEGPGGPPRAILLDVTPMTLRLATAGGYTIPIIERNTPIPFERVKTFFTARANQTAVAIKVYQGDGQQEIHNERLGSFVFSDLSPGDDGRALVEVTFGIDADGILQIAARDPVVNRMRTAKIDFAHRLADDQYIDPDATEEMASRIQL